jgi:predicted nucleic acid-binding protein
MVVLDACAMIALLRGEPGAEVVADALLGPEGSCLAHAVNLCEVYYDFHRVAGEAVALSAVDHLLAAGVVERQDLSRELWQTAGRLKARHRISLADAFALALAETTGAELLSSDRHELEPLARAGVARVRFIR